MLIGRDKERQILLGTLEKSILSLLRYMEGVVWVRLFSLEKLLKTDSIFNIPVPQI